MENEDDVFARLYINLKGKKRKDEDWISIAKDCQKLEKKYNSQKILADKLGVSYQLIRSILSLLSLPKGIREKIQKGDILFDAAQRLNTIEDKKKQAEVAEIISGLPSHKQREIILHAKRFNDSDLSKFKKRVLKKTKTEKVHVAIIPLNEDLQLKLKKESKKNKSTLQQTILNILENWGSKK
ncbi:hypothetical protein [Nitrosopumilus piranensis]|uniref:ParB/Spo0J HTH domain-containing protein n=1 Tax=Nitrosopumilus piranensis TaxID=1582439 RepID=A0A0C5BVF0_9ARCH|nr:hypothetical protein [Nitrosopumilus piranensis]AJM92204.1 hypothetical protein NPIRD3C_0992 [Nitrosopumilus piranensis]